MYKKVKVDCSPYSITKRRVPELIPVLGSQPVGGVSHKSGGRLPLLSARQLPSQPLRGLLRGCDLNPGPSASESGYRLLKCVYDPI